MSIFDGNVQKEYEIDIFAGKVKAAKDDYEKARRNAYAGVGNGCDDYRNIVPEVESKWNNFTRLKNEFKSKFHFSFESYEHDINTGVFDNHKQNTYMTAEDARKMLAKAQEEDNIELESILDQLRTAITERKENYIFVYDNLKPYTVRKLEDLGFNVSESNTTVDRPGICPQRKISF